MQLATELANPRCRDAKDLSYVARRFARREHFGHTLSRFGQRLEPRSKIDPCRCNVSRARVSILHHKFLPLIIWVIEVIQPFD